MVPHAFQPPWSSPVFYTHPLSPGRTRMVPVACVGETESTKRK